MISLILIASILTTLVLIGIAFGVLRLLVVVLAGCSIALVISVSIVAVSVSILVAIT